MLALYFDEPVYSVLTLILIFMLIAFTLLLLNVEFLAYVYIIVYVGAVVLLFIFVVFMLGPVYTKAYQVESLSGYKLFLVKFVILFSSAVWDFVFFSGYNAYGKTVTLSTSVYTNDIFIFSNLLYTDHFFLVGAVAVILLIAMIAPIVFHFNYKNTL
jgi:NADH:ubiquinone oxidoreductase subunit 6 (subunit J)